MGDRQRTQRLVMPRWKCSGNGSMTTSSMPYGNQRTVPLSRRCHRLRKRGLPGLCPCRNCPVPQFGHSARMVVGYLYDLDPMDLHAWFPGLCRRTVGFTLMRPECTPGQPDRDRFMEKDAGRCGNPLLFYQYNADTVESDCGGWHLMLTAPHGDYVFYIAPKTQSSAVG